jgi:hypothetical protein
MPGRRLCNDAEANQRGFRGAEASRRRAVLSETIDAFARAEARDRYHRAAQRNVDRWRSSLRDASPLRIDVDPYDWGEVALSLTKSEGVCFAVLNMANAFVPGGAYVEGAAAQEENMFRRTDCHFSIGPDGYDAQLDMYVPEMTRLLSAEDGVVYLDRTRPRVCIRGAEDRSRQDLGYDWLPESEIFPFFELRAAAQDLRDGRPFDPADARRRIAAQLDTLRAAQIRHAVLGAFGCGAFMNPSVQVATIYREEIESRSSDFSVIAFAIFAPGYGPDNYTPFAKAFLSQTKRMS